MRESQKESVIGLPMGYTPIESPTGGAAIKIVPSSSSLLLPERRILSKLEGDIQVRRNSIKLLTPGSLASKPTDTAKCCCRRTIDRTAERVSRRKRNEVGRAMCRGELRHSLAPDR